ncbi:prepilin-type N-terminal cleavage/methylation domain-containing protein [Acinetobacter indicus]|nr:prepilin-type N-terminal cleavage/methylation domain-containing protein [Acinetobacter indicus]MDM1276966.1 prepilin-type N-terminal cleavage/methylation domain-containing protein [Acinetobacter indicus]
MKKGYKRRFSTSFNQGFTLIELMIAVVVIAILAAIATASYSQFIKRSTAAQAQQEIAKLSEQLERYKSRNFSYKGFNASYLYSGGTGFDVSTQVLTLNNTYQISIVDGMLSTPLLTDTNSLGNQWAIRAISSDPSNYSYLLTSNGLRCKNKSSNLVNYNGCGIGAEEW